MSGLETNLKSTRPSQVITRSRPTPPAKGRDRDRNPENWSRDRSRDRSRDLLLLFTFKDLFCALHLKTLKNIKTLHLMIYHCALHLKTFLPRQTHVVQIH